MKHTTETALRNALAMLEAIKVRTTDGAIRELCRDGIAPAKEGLESTKTEQNELWLGLSNAAVTLNHIARGKANSGRWLTTGELRERAEREEVEARQVLAKFKA